MPDAMKRPVINHLIFWILSGGLLTVIYGVAYGNITLGLRVILMLLPVHMAYFYAVAYWVMPRLFFRRHYLLAALAIVCCGLVAALLYRLNELLLSDPFIYRFYKSSDPSFTWSKLNGSFYEQLLRPTDFVNAVERSNVIVWIGVALRFVKLWFERKQAAMHAELNFLKGQIHPHFLFNTLNNLYSLAINESRQTPEIILGLSNILRYMLYECKAEVVPISRDIGIIKNYTSLEKLRYEDRLDLTVNINGNYTNQLIAPLLMLPFIENAFKHGAGETVEGAWITIDIEVTDNHLFFKVANGKPEYQPEDYDDDFGRVGLANVKKRLLLLYPGKHRLTILNEDEVFIAELLVDLSYIPKLMAL
jgi:hypothetical protein